MALRYWALSSSTIWSCPPCERCSRDHDRALPFRISSRDHWRTLVSGAVEVLKLRLPVDAGVFVCHSLGRYGDLRCMSIELAQHGTYFDREVGHDSKHSITERMLIIEIRTQVLMKLMYKLTGMKWS